MAQDWEYAKATRWIAEHGGPKEAFERVKDYYLSEGFQKGAQSKNPMIVLVGAAGLAVGVGIKYVYDIIAEKKAEKAANKVAEQEKVKKAEAELIAAMSQEPTAGIPDTDEKEGISCPQCDAE